MEKQQTKKGIESLKSLILADTLKGENCFNENGCDKKNQKIKCERRHCDKYKWVIDRAAAYAELLGSTVEKVVATWEERRDYWYVNYYQDANQPLPGGDRKMILYDDWKKVLVERFGEDSTKWKFVCVNCGNVQCGQDFIDAKVSEDWRNLVFFSCIGRVVKGKGCDWTLGGLFQLHKTVVLSGANISPVFETAEL